MAEKKNLLKVVPKLTRQEANELVFFLKCSDPERHQRRRYNAPVIELGFLSLDEARAALRPWHPSPGLLSKLESES
jgi:hypothetical protein